MNKNDEQTQQPVTSPTTEQKTAKGNAADFLKDLQANGFVVLTAQSRDELAEMVGQIPADIHYGAGAVGFFYETGEYTLRIDLTTND